MPLILQDVKIYWNDDIDNFLTKVESSDDVLSKFFSLQDWDIIKLMHIHVLEQKDFHFQNKGFCFTEQSSVEFVDIYEDEEETRIHLEDFNTLMQHLFDLMIDGANEDHHSVRYEPWFELFTENANQLRGRTANQIEDDNSHYVYEAFIAEQGY